MRLISQWTASFWLASFASAATEDGITVTCNDDGTLNITLEYEQAAEILEFTYGDCTKDSASLRGTDQLTNFNWELTLNQTACNTGNTLRKLSYNQTIDVRVGYPDKGSGRPEITLASFDIDSYCVYESTYSVKFDYGTLSTDSHEFDEAGGDVNITFTIESMDSSFSTSASAPKTGGETIYLQLRVTSDNLEWAGSDNDDEGKQFVITKCEVEDTINSLSYTLWESTADNCTNNDINLEVTYDWSKHHWNFKHTLFLVGSHRESTFELDCSVTVCDASDDVASTCDDVFSIETCSGIDNFSGNNPNTCDGTHDAWVKVYHPSGWSSCAELAAQPVASSNDNSNGNCNSSKTKTGTVFSTFRKNMWWDMCECECTAAHTLAKKGT